jgi:tetratricopeptide (TPR) repeat protein
MTEELHRALVSGEIGDGDGLLHHPAARGIRAAQFSTMLNTHDEQDELSALVVAVMTLQRDPQEGMELGEEAVRLRPGSVRWLIHASMAASAAEKHERALAHARRALELEPDDPLVHQALGRALVGAGQYQEAEAPLRRAVEGLSSKGMALHLLAQCFYGRARGLEIPDLLRSLVDAHPEDASLLAAVAEVLFDRGDTSGAQQALERASTLGLEDPKAWDLLASLRAPENPRSAMEAAIKAEKLSDGEDGWKGRSAALLSSGRREEARSVLEAGYQRYANERDPTNLILLAGAEQNMGDPARPLEHLRGAARRDLWRAEPHVLEMGALGAVVAHDLPLACHFYEWLVSRPADYWTSVPREQRDVEWRSKAGLAGCLLQDGEFSRAGEITSELVQRWPEESYSHFLRLHFLVATGSPGWKDHVEALSSIWSPAGAVQAAVEALKLADRTDEARPLLEHFVRQEPTGNPEEWVEELDIGFNTLVGLLEEGGDLRDHEALLRQWMGDCPAAAEPCSRLGTLLDGNGRYEEADAVWLEGLRRAPEDFIYVMSYAFRQGFRGNWPSATELAQRTLARIGSSPAEPWADIGRQLKMVIRRAAEGGPPLLRPPERKSTRPSLKDLWWSIGPLHRLLLDAGGPFGSYVELTD